MEKSNFHKLKVQVQLVQDSAARKPVAVESPKEIYQLVRAETQKWDRERFLAIMLDARNGVIGIDEVSSGSVTGNLVHPREVFKAAILANAVAVALVHNHLSGDVEPSQADLEITRRLVESGKILGIEVIDHLVVNKEGFYSFKQKGLI